MLFKRFKRVLWFCRLIRSAYRRTCYVGLSHPPRGSPMTSPCFTCSQRHQGHTPFYTRIYGHVYDYHLCASYAYTHCSLDFDCTFLYYRPSTGASTPNGRSVSQPPRPRTDGSRPASRDAVHRPPTRSGRNSRPNTQESAAQKGGPQSGGDKAMRPSSKAQERLGSKGKDLDDYSNAFNTRPKIPRLVLNEINVSSPSP